MAWRIDTSQSTNEEVNTQVKRVTDRLEWYLGLQYRDQLHRVSPRLLSGAQMELMVTELAFTRIIPGKATASCHLYS